MISLPAIQRKAGGGLQCNPIAVAAFDNLLAAHGPCDQQDAADGMVDFAKKLGNDPDMIRFAQIFAQQPRNTVSPHLTPTSLNVSHRAPLPSSHRPRVCRTVKR